MLLNRVSEQLRHDAKKSARGARSNMLASLSPRSNNQNSQSKLELPELSISHNPSIRNLLRSINVSQGSDRFTTIQDQTEQGEISDAAHF